MNPFHEQTNPDQRQQAIKLPTTSCPVFVPGTLERELTVDTTIRLVLTAIVIVGLVAASAWGSNESAWQMLLIFGIIGIWFAATASATRAGQEIPKITSLLETNLDGAETLLAHTLKRKHMPKAVRLLVYQRLAVLRMRQNRFAEAAAICQAVLAQKHQGLRHLDNDSVSASSKLAHSEATWTPHRNTEGLHISLLLMLVESCLRCQDMAGAYAGLQQLHQRRLRLLNLLQLLTLQTQYEVTTRQRTALHQVGKKISMAELMPAPQCGEIHALLTVAATQNNQTDLADWLWRRAQLLCTTEQLNALGVTQPAVKTGMTYSATTPE